MSIVKFSNLLNEAMKSTADTTAKRTHLEHPEDLAFDGHDSVGSAEHHLREFHNYLLGRRSKITASTKIDGAPAVHVGMDKDGNYFVATKGLFNKNPKVYRTEQEIDSAYGADHPVGHILKQTLRHAVKTLPKDMKPGEVYKGDVTNVAGGEPERAPKREGGFITTQPNVLKYKYPVDSQEGRALARSQIGIVWHTKYDRNGNASSISPKDRSKFTPDDNVFTMNPDVKANPANYSPEEQSQFENHMENARREYGKIQPDAYDRIAGHNDTLRTYINQTVRSGDAPSFDGYTAHLAGRQQKDVDSVKTQAAKDRKVQQHADFIQQAHTNRKDIENLLRLHGHLQAAKNVLVGVADKNSPSTNELPGGQPFGHEGYVTTDKQGGAVKMVDRRFSQALLNGLGAISQAKAAQPQQPMNEETDPNTVVPHTIWYGRGQGLHNGHVMGAQLAMDDAARTGGGHSIIFTHTHDRNNPLTPEQKLYYAQRGLPKGANVTMTSPESPSLMQQAADLNKKGVTQLRIVAGSDRIPQYKSLFDRYNGVYNERGEGFNFKHGVVFIPAGDERKGDGDGLTSYSGSAVRKAAVEDDAPTFNRMTSSLLSPEDKDRMRADIKAGLAKFPAKKKKLAEDFDEEERRQAAINAPETPLSSALKKYTPIGTVDELGSALHKGDIKGAILPAAKLATNAIPSVKIGMMAGSAVGAAEAIRDKKTLNEDTKSVFKKVISRYNSSPKMPSAAKATTSAAGAGVTAAALSTNDSDDQPKSQAATPPNPPTTAGGSGTSILDPSYTKVNPPAKVASLPPAKDSTRATEPASGVKSFSKYEPPKSNKEFYDRMTKAGVSAGMSEPQAKQMASLSALESNWGKSSMTNRANNPFGQTITQKQIGSNGIVGSTVGADGQLHAVYDSPESAVSHHVSKWGKHYTDDPATTYSNMAKGGYNTNPAWGPTIHGVHKSMNPDQPSKIDENTTGSVGGLGFNTGNPAADANALQQYIDTNGALAKDDENGNLIKMHNALHAPLGFKEFDPKKDLAKGKK